jgi:hypothetical protein
LVADCVTVATSGNAGTFCRFCFSHSRDPAAFNRRPVTVLLARLETRSPPASTALRISTNDASGNWAAASATTPLTCGVAIDVPLKKP